MSAVYFVAIVRVLVSSSRCC